MPFDPKQYLADAGPAAAPKFDSSAYLADNSHPADEGHPILDGLTSLLKGVSTLNPTLLATKYAAGMGRETGQTGDWSRPRTFAEHGADTAMMGYLPQVEGGARSLVNDQSYVQNRDAVASRMAADKEAHTADAYLGQGAGIVAQTALPFAPLARFTQAAEGASAGKQILSGVGAGAANGFLSNPGETPGEISPVQAGGRAINAGIGGTLGALFGSVGAFTKNGKNISDDIKLAKDPGRALDTVQAEMDNSIASVNKNYIEPRSNRVKSLVAGKEIQFNPDNIETTTPGLAKAMGKRREPVVTQGSVQPNEFPQYQLEGMAPPPPPAETPVVPSTQATFYQPPQQFPQTGPRSTQTPSQPIQIAGGQVGMSPGNTIEMPGNTGPVSLEGVKALKLRQLLDAKANYGASKPFDNTSVAKGEEAKAAADILRRKLGDIHPDVDRLQGESSEALRMIGNLRSKEAGGPITAVKSGADSVTPTIAKIDQFAGNQNLRKLGDRLNTADGLLLNPSKLLNPLSLPGEVKRTALRGAVETASGISTAVDPNSLQAILRAIYENKK